MSDKQLMIMIGGLLVVIAFVFLVILEQNHELAQQNSECIERGGAATVGVGGVFACVQKLR